MNPKDIQNELNSKKGTFVQQIVTDTVKHTTITAEKTKDTNYAGQMVKAAQDLASENTNIPDIIITTIAGTGGGSTVSSGAEPQVIIRGIHGDDKNKSYIGYMAKTMYVPLSEADKEIRIIFETKNVKLEGGGYRYLIVAKEQHGKFFRRLVVSDNNRFNERDVNILQNERLPPAKYDVYVWLLENNSNKSILNSKGEKVLDYARIEVKPVVPGTTTPGTTTPGTPEAKKKEEKGPKGLIGPHIPGAPNPEIKITNKGDFGKTFAGADLVPLVFEVKNITKYNASIFLQKDSNNAIELNTRTYDKPIIKLSVPIRDLIRKKDPSLNLSEYKKLVVLLRDEKGNQLSGTKLIDSVDIKINPLQLTAGGPAAVATRTPSVEVNLPDELTNDKEQRVVFTVRNIDDTSGKIDYDYEITVGDPYGGKPVMRSSGKHTTISPFADPNIDLSKVKVFYTSGIGGPRPLPTRITITIIDNITKRKITTYKDVRISEKKGTIY